MKLTHKKISYFMIKRKKNTTNWLTIETVLMILHQILSINKYSKTITNLNSKMIFTPMNSMNL